LGSLCATHDCFCVFNHFTSFFSKDIRDSIILLILFLLPVGGLYVFCQLFRINHFVSSRYFITFLPFFLIILYLSLEAIELRFGKLMKWMRLTPLFVILFVLSNLMILPFYYRAEKQDVRGLVTYLKGNLQEGDKIFLEDDPLTTAVLHYLELTRNIDINPTRSRRFQKMTFELQTPFVYGNRTFTIYHYRPVVTDTLQTEVGSGSLSAKGRRKSSEKVPPVFLKGTSMELPHYFKISG